MRRWLRQVGGLLAAVVASGVGLGCALSHRLPQAAPGPEALARAERIESAVGIAAWQDVGAVSFSFAGRNHHLWDRQRELHRVEFGAHVVLYDLKTREGRAWKGETELQGEDRVAALDRAWAMWCNDTFWLNPFDKFRDPGVTLGAVELEDGREGLLVQYSQGGVTPGDSYLWIMDASGMPVAWRMWVSVIPIPGIETSWEGWQELPGGARISTTHKLGPLPLRIEALKAASTLAALVGPEDPFAPILGATP